MGMTIDEAISQLKVNQEYYKTDTQDNYMGFDEEDHESIDLAIDIMHKYKKIQEIIADWKNDGGVFEMSESYWMRLIKEVCGEKKWMNEKNISKY